MLVCVHMQASWVPQSRILNLPSQPFVCCSYTMLLLGSGKSSQSYQHTVIWWQKGVCTLDLVTNCCNKIRNSSKAISLPPDGSLTENLDLLASNKQGYDRTRKRKWCPKQVNYLNCDSLMIFVLWHTRPEAIISFSLDITALEQYDSFTLTQQVWNEQTPFPWHNRFRNKKLFPGHNTFRTNRLLPLGHNTFRTTKPLSLDTTRLEQTDPFSLDTTGLEQTPFPWHNRFRTNRSHSLDTTGLEQPNPFPLTPEV